MASTSIQFGAGFDVSQMQSGAARMQSTVARMSARIGRISSAEFGALAGVSAVAFNKVLAIARAAGSGDTRPGVHSLAVMPDHVHVAARAPAGSSPAEVAAGLRRALNLGCALFSDRLYAGTFSDYPLACVRLER